MTALNVAPSMVGSVAAIAAVERAEQLRRVRRRQREALIWLTRIGSGVVLLAAWEWAANSGRIDPFFFSRPSAVWTFIVEGFTTGTVWPHITVTLRETVLGFAIGSTLGIAAGIMRAQSPFLASATGPLLVMLNALPRVALAPMFIIWFGIGETSKIALAISLVFFILMVNTEAGIKSIDSEYIVATRALGATRRQLFRKVLLPGAVPSMFGGLKLAVVYSLLGVVVGEMLAARRGLGQQIQSNASSFNTAGVLGTILVLALIALVMSGAVSAAEHRLLHWRDAGK